MQGALGALLAFFYDRCCEAGDLTKHIVVSLFPSVRPQTLHPTPYTLHPTPFTLHPTPYTLNPKPYTLHPTPYTLNLNP